MKNPTEKFPEVKGESRDKLGLKAKVSGRTYDKGIQVKQKQYEKHQ